MTQCVLCGEAPGSDGTTVVPAIVEEAPLTEQAKSVVIQLLCQRVRHHQQSKQRAWSYSCCVRGSDTINRASKERGHTVVVPEGQTPLTEQAKSVVIQLLCQRVRHHQQSKQRAW